jgi:hypothetical protein
MLVKTDGAIKRHWQHWAQDKKNNKKTQYNTGQETTWSLWCMSLCESIVECSCLGLSVHFVGIFDLKCSFELSDEDGKIKENT